MSNMHHTATKRRRHRRKRLDYRYWGAMGYWSPAEGAALLVGIDPNAVDDREFNEAAIFERFDKLRTHATRAAEVGSVPEKCSPLQFIDWAHRSHVRVPAALRSAVLKIAGKLKLDGRERDSILSLIISMAKAKYKYDPEDERSPATKAIQKDVELNGLEISDATVLKYLREGAGLLGRRKLQ